LFDAQIDVAGVGHPAIIIPVRKAGKSFSTMFARPIIGQWTLFLVTRPVFHAKTRFPNCKKSFPKDAGAISACSDASQCFHGSLL
jgi:hypothetical protein